MNIQDEDKFGIKESSNNKFIISKNANKITKSGFISKLIFILAIFLVVFLINSIIIKTRNKELKTFLSKKSIDSNKNEREFFEKLKLFLDKDEIIENEMMFKHTTFQLGGPAKFFIKPKSINNIIKVLKLCKEYSIEYFILGNGSNLLVSEHGYDGVVIF